MEKQKGVFVDLEKAYDELPRPKLYEEVRQRSMRVVQEMYGRQSGEEMDGVKLQTDRLGQAGVSVDNDVCR